jgi:hypothetical protein
MRMWRAGRASPVVRRRTLLPAVVTTIALAGLSACANGGGLRVEGADAPSSTASPSAPPSVMGESAGPTQARTPAVTVDLAEVRVKLLADKHLPDFSRRVLVKCSVISRCLSRGKTVDVMDNGTPQQIVLIHSLEGFVFGFFLIAVEPAGPRPMWSLKVDQPTINASPQGDLVVESKVYALDDKVCCPSGRRVEVYRWNGRQMIKVSSTDQEGD